MFSGGKRDDASLERAMFPVRDVTAMGLDM